MVFAWCYFINGKHCGILMKGKKISELATTKKWASLLNENVPICYTKQRWNVWISDNRLRVV